MKGEEHYIDQLFKDHFEDFAKSPSDKVWKGVVKEGTLANGKPFALPGGWKSGLTLIFTMVLSLVLLSGSDATSVAAEDKGPEQITLENSSAPEAIASLTVSELNEVTTIGEVQEVESTSNNHRVPVSQGLEQGVEETDNVIPTMEEALSDVASEEETYSTDSRAEDIMKLTVPFQGLSAGMTNHLLSTEAKRALKRELFADTYYKKPTGGHWFVAGGLVLDSSFGDGSGYADGLVFGAGKYLNKNSFVQVSLRGVWSYGFNMRATYTRLLLPGKVRPFLQTGVSWGERLDVHVGAGVMYEPSPLKKWRIFASVNYENGSYLLESNSQPHAVMELGVQLRLSGTEPLISDNNWMNSVPHYKVPRDWYLEGSSNFAFFDKTKVTRISFYAGKNLNKRLFVRGGLRLGRDRITLPAQLQYHAIVRRKLRFGFYGGPSLDISQFGLGAELGLIAYYEIKPGWSLFVAPVILDNSQYKDRIFETGIRYYLGKKK